MFASGSIRRLSAARLVPATLLLVTGCGGVEASRGHDQVAALVADRAGARTRWEGGPPPEAQIATWIRAQLAPGLTRQAAVEIALVNNPTLAETYEHLGASQADMVQAGLLRNPTLGIDLGFGNGPTSELRGSLIQDFLDLFILRTRKEIARDQFVADTLRVADAALQTVAGVSKAFYDVQAGSAVVAQRDQTLETLAVAAALVERRHDAGTATGLEYAEETAALEEARLDLARDQLELVERRERLNRWLGLSGEATAWSLREGLPAAPEELPVAAGLDETAMKQRLDVAAATQQAQLMAKAVGLARQTRAFGRLEIGVDAHQDPDGPRVIGPNLVVELPLFDQRQATIARLEAERREAERRRERVVIDAHAEVRVALAQLTNAHDVVAHYQRTLLPLRRTIVELTQEAYNGMFVGVPALLTAKRAELDAYRGYVEALRAYWSARAELERAVGGRLGATHADAVATIQRTK